MTKNDQKRLASIRMQSEKWIAQMPDAVNWEAAFLLKIIDAQAKELRRVKK